MVTMNIVGAGFKPVPAKNKKDIRKIVVQHCRNQSGEDKTSGVSSDMCRVTSKTSPATRHLSKDLHKLVPVKMGNGEKKFLHSNTIS